MLGLGFMELAIIFLLLALFFVVLVITGRTKASIRPAAWCGAGAIGFLTLIGLAVSAPRLTGGGGPGVSGMLVFFAVLTLGFLALGGVVVAMITNPKTRPWGIALAVVGPLALVGFLLVAPILAYRSVHVAHPVKIRTTWQLPFESVKPEPAPIPLDEDARSAVEREIERARAEVAKAQEEVRRIRDDMAQKSHARRSLAKRKDAPGKRDKRKADVKRPEAEAAPSEEAADKTKEPAAETEPKPEEEPSPSDGESDSRRPGHDSAEDTDPAEISDPAKASDKPSPPENAAPASTPAVTDKPAEAPAPSDEKPPAPADEKPPAEAAAPVTKPDWIDSREGKVGDEYRSAIIVGPYTTRLECDRELLPEVHRAVANYVDIYLGAEAKRRVRLSDDYVQQRVIKETWEAPRASTVGPMTQLHVLLAFDRKTNDLVKQKWHEVQVQERVWRAGLILGYVLMGMAAVYCVLKIDVVTQGRSRPNMLLAAAAVAMGVVGIAIFYACPRDDNAGGICVFFGLPLLLGAVGLTWLQKTRRFGVAILAGLALASLGLLRFVV